MKHRNETGRRMAKIETNASASVVRTMRIGTFPEPVCSSTPRHNWLLREMISPSTHVIHFPGCAPHTVR